MCHISNKSNYIYYMRYLFILLVLFPNYVFSQSKTDTIAFKLNKQNNICIKARIDDSDTLLLMFHTSASDITLTREAIKNKIQIKLENTDQIQTWGGMAQSENSEHHSFYINNLEWSDLTVFSDDNSGIGTDGKFGVDIFKGKIVALNYDNLQMIVSDKLPKKLRGYSKSNLYFEKGSMFIDGKIKSRKSTYTDKFMFHSGYGRSILLDPKIAEKYNMNELKTIEESELRDSFNNVFKIETKEIPEVTVGGLKIKNVPLSIAARSSDIPMRVFGNDLLKRFNVIFDFQKNEIYLKPNHLRKVPYYKKG
jgi:hypothetical protein